MFITPIAASTAVSQACHGWAQARSIARRWRGSRFNRSLPSTKPPSFGLPFDKVDLLADAETGQQGTTRQHLLPVPTSRLDLKETVAAMHDRVRLHDGHIQPADGHGGNQHAERQRRADTTPLRPRDVQPIRVVGTPCVFVTKLFHALPLSPHCWRHFTGHYGPALSNIIHKNG
jgi:hypothetical protein